MELEKEYTYRMIEDKAQEEDATIEELTKQIVGTGLLTVRDDIFNDIVAVFQLTGATSSDYIYKPIMLSSTWSDTGREVY